MEKYFALAHLTYGKAAEIEVIQERCHVYSEKSWDGERGTSRPFAAEY
jgi:hypothetical protein